MKYKLSLTPAALADLGHWVLEDDSSNRYYADDVSIEAPCRTGAEAMRGYRAKGWLIVSGKIVQEDRSIRVVAE